MSSKGTSSSLILTALLLCVFLHQGYSLTINGKYYLYLLFNIIAYELRDLESNTTYFNTEAQHWTITNNLTSAITSECYGSWIMGGYGITGQGGRYSRFYSSLPSHNMIYFTIYFWIIDLETSSDLFKIYIDNQLIDDWNSIGYSYASFPVPNICGGTQKDFPSVAIYGNAAHNRSSLTLEIASMLSASDVFSIGFRNISILFQTTSTVSTLACTFISSSSTSGVSCLCGQGGYDQPGSSGCASCNSACSTCISSSATTSCASCKFGYSYDGQICSQCTGGCQQCNGTLATNCVRCPPNSYLYWNGTCQSTCNSPLIITSEGQYYSCDLPCPSSEFYYQNSTCLLSCPSPFVLIIYDGVNYCNFPCTSSSYYYPNGTCASSCNSPLISTSSGVEKYCNSPCLTSQFFYQNSSCKPSCNSPFVQSYDGTLNYCKSPCSNSLVLYWNSSCLSTCPTSFQTTLYNYQYCNFHCDISQYQYWDGSCLNTCNRPYVQSSNTDSYKFCNLPCNQNEYLYENGSCFPKCDYLIETTNNVTYCNYPCNSNEFLYQNNSCRSNCISPYVQYIVDSNLTLCNSPCPLNQIYYQNDGTCVSNCDSPSILIINGLLHICQTLTNSSTQSSTLSSVQQALQSINEVAGAASSIIRSNSANSAFVTSLAKLVKYVRFLQIPILESVRKSLNDNAASGAFSISMTFTFTMPDSWKNKFPMHPLPPGFEDSGYHSSYLVNHWESISNYVILFGIGVVATLLEVLVSKWKNRVLFYIFKRISIIFRWNFVLYTVFNTYDDLTFFPTLEFRNIDFNIKTFNTELLDMYFGIHMGYLYACKVYSNLSRSYENEKASQRC